MIGFYRTFDDYWKSDTYRKMGFILLYKYQDFNELLWFDVLPILICVSFFTGNYRYSFALVQSLLCQANVRFCS